MESLKAPVPHSQNASTMLEKPQNMLLSETSPKNLKHISVCICTYKRPALLRKLLTELQRQVTDGLFTYSIVVAENDPGQGGQTVVSEFAATSAIPIKYCLEPQPNIARARNRALENATGEFVAFIDDDEYPTNEWLLSLFRLCDKPDVGGVLGPVVSYYGEGAPKWVLKGGFFDRPQHPTGLVLDWAQTRTGNVLLKRALFAGDPKPFNVQCVEGSDQEFFKRMMRQGYTFIWCNEAVVFEIVPPARWKRSFLIRRALSRGIFSLRNHGFPISLIARSLVAAPAYAAALPVALVFGQDRFMQYLYKFSYHAGRLLALVRLNSKKQIYVSD